MEEPSQNPLTGLDVRRSFRTRVLDAYQRVGEGGEPAVAETLAVSMGGCIASALTGGSAVEVMVRAWGLSAHEQDEVLVRWRRGESLRLIARRLGKRGPSVRAFVLQTGGCNGTHSAATRGV